MKRPVRSINPAPSIFLDDLYHVAFLKLHGIEAAPAASAGRVSFAITVTPEVSGLLAEIQRNELVPVGDFIRACKTVRGQMLSLRTQDKGVRQ
jgi:hypothetical protein